MPALLRSRCRRILLHIFNKRWRKSGGARRSLGWIPINTGAASWKSGQVYHNGHYFKVWDSYELSGYKFRSVSFNEDARGRWYFNVVVEADVQPGLGQDAVGIDLGLKDIAKCSDGRRLEISSPIVIWSQSLPSPSAAETRNAPVLSMPKSLIGVKMNRTSLAVS
ncbi:hypothetical protein ACI2KR_32025 [Pseudomonas luteola]